MGVKHRIPHDLGLDLGRRVTARALESYRDQFPEYAPTGEWVTPSRAEVRFAVTGRTLRGAIEVFADAVELELEVPFLFRPFKAAAVKVIEGEIRRWIGEAKAGRLGDASSEQDG